MLYTLKWGNKSEIVHNDTFDELLIFIVLLNGVEISSRRKAAMCGTELPQPPQMFVSMNALHR